MCFSREVKKDGQGEGVCGESVKIGSKDHHTCSPDEPNAC
jgi:hypothetical protein